MALTAGFVKKLILQYIGGTKVKGNSAKVDAGGKVVIVKTGAGTLAGIKDAVNGLTSKYSNIGDITQSLVSNPLGSSIQSMGSNITKLQSDITSLSGSLSPSVVTSLTNSMTSLNSSVASFSVHTSILSGLIDNVEVLNENQLSLSDITSLGKVAMDTLGVSKEEILQSASSLYSTEMAIDIDRSLNPDIPGGLSDVLQTIKSLDSNDTSTIAHYAAVFADLANDHKTQIDTKRESDLSAQAALKLKIDTLDTMASLVPEDDNEIAKELFNVVATDELKNISSQLI